MDTSIPTYIYASLTGSTLPPRLEATIGDGVKRGHGPSLCLMHGPARTLVEVCEQVGGCVYWNVCVYVCACVRPYVCQDVRIQFSRRLVVVVVVVERGGGEDRDGRFVDN
jgi:hypothetical protein